MTDAAQINDGFPGRYLDKNETMESLGVEVLCEKDFPRPGNSSIGPETLHGSVADRKLFSRRKRFGCGMRTTGTYSAGSVVGNNHRCSLRIGVVLLERVSLVEALYEEAGKKMSMCICQKIPNESLKKG